MKHLPDFIAPMLATLVSQPFDDEEWLFEIKWDGYRALAFIDNGKVHLTSRSRHSLNQQFPSIVEDLKKIKSQVVLDGEVVVLDEAGKSHFQLIQNYQKEGKGALYYYIFDMLFMDGKDLRQLPLIERKKMLKKCLKGLSHSRIRYSDHVRKRGKEFYFEAVKNRLEGIMAKKISSTYQSRRSSEWLKIKTQNTQEFVIGGFTAPRGSRRFFGALLIGMYDENKELCYVGHVGGGFDEVLLHQVYAKLKPLIQTTSPFKTKPKANAPVTWVKPRLVCEVSFAEWTEDNQLRQPIFQGLRKAGKGDRKNSGALSLSNLEKMYWPREKYTKGDLIEYYTSIAPFILPHLKNRPIVLHRFPEGIEGEEFYQKDLKMSHPDWVKTFPIQHEGKWYHYLLIDNLRSLLYAVNLGSIDIHPWMSTCKKLENPDYCVIDLDPHDISFKKVIEVALAMHELLEQVNIKHYCKTSGGKGLHILIPLHGKYSYEQSRQFATIIALCIHKQFPRATSLERVPRKRPKKIYLDCLQNRFGQTIVPPYAVRPRPKALVSTPLSWDEVNADLDVTQFNIKTIPARLKKTGDLFKSVLGAGINMKSAIKSLEKLLS